MKTWRLRKLITQSYLLRFDALLSLFQTLVVFFFFARNLKLVLTLMQPVYVKDDFFDSLFSGTFGRGGPNGRGRPSERRRVDTEV
jgi:hypothetical protein